MVKKVKKAHKPPTKTNKQVKNLDLDFDTTKKVNFNFAHKGKKWSWSIKFGISFVTFVTIIGVMLLQFGVFTKGRLGKTLQLTLIALGDKSSQIANSITPTSSSDQIKSSSNDLAILSKDISELNLTDTKGLSDELKKTLILTIGDYRQYINDLGTVTSEYPNVDSARVIPLIDLATRIKLNLEFLNANKIDIKVDEQIFKIPNNLLELIGNKNDQEILENPDVMEDISNFVSQELQKCQISNANCPQGIDQFTSYSIGEISKIDEYYKVIVSIVKGNKTSKQYVFYIRLVQDQFQIIAIES